MTTAYTSLLGLALPVTGELSGTWGDTVNNSITSLLDSAIAGTTTLSSDADVTLTTTTGASNTSRQAILLWTAGGTVTRNITAPAQSKIYTVINASSSTQSIVLRGVGPTTGVTIVKGESAVCAWNGSDFIKISNTSGAGVFTTLSVTGVATFSAGTAALPAITTTGDTNTGIFFPAADTIAFAEGGAESMRIDASGNLGIGTASPAQRLNVATASGNCYARVDRASQSTGQVGYQWGGGTSSTDWLVYLPASSNDLTFFGNSAERMRLDSSGQLKLQTGALQVFGALDAGQISAGVMDWQSVTNNTRFLSYGPSGTSGGFSWTTVIGGGAGTQAMTLDASGNLGLNNTSPTTLITSIGGAGGKGIVLSGQVPVLYFEDTNGTDASIFVENGDIAFVNGTTEAARFSSGNLLVGTTGLNSVWSTKLTLSNNAGTTKWAVGPWVGGENSFIVSTGATSGVYLNGTSATSWSSNSDESLKENLVPIANAAEKVCSLRAVTGNYIEDEEKTSHAFLIAQDVQAVLPEAVAITTRPDGTEVLGLAYTETIPLLVAAIQEQQALIQTLTARITALESA